MEDTSAAKSQIFRMVAVVKGRTLEIFARSTVLPRRYFVSASGEKIGWFAPEDREEDELHHKIPVSDHSSTRSTLRIPRQKSSVMYFTETIDIQDEGRFLALQITDVPDGETTRSTPRALTVWDVHNSSRHATFWRQGDNEELVAARFVPQRDWLLGVIRTSEKGKSPTDRLRLWDVSKMTEIHSIDLPQANSIAFSADGLQLAVAYREQGAEESQWYLGIYSINDMKELHKFSIASVPSAYWPVPARIAFRPGRNEIAVQRSESVDLWDLNDGQIRQSILGPNDRDAFAWTANGTRLVTLRNGNGLGDSIMTVWNPDNGQRLLVQGVKSSVTPGNTLKCVPGTNKLFSWSDGIQYLDGTPATENN